MASLFERLSTALNPVRYDDLARRAQERDVMRQKQPWLWQQPSVFQELDDRMIDMIRRLKDYEVVYGTLPLTSISMSEEDRLDIVQRSRIYATVDPLISHAISLWTSYGFGQEVKVTAGDENAQQVWDEFWVANERIFGDRDIHEMSDALLTDGEVWLACYASTTTGDLTVRVWPTEQITDVVTVPGDQTIPLYYKRKFTDKVGTRVRYYADYQATPEQLRRAVMPQGAEKVEEEDGMVIRLMPIQFKRLGAVGSGWLRGWPLTTAALDWAQAYRQFCEDRAAVARKIASEVEEFRAATGQRGIEALAALRASRLQSGTSYTETNPPPGAGSERWMNQAIESRRLPLSTGAQDAATDSIMLLGQVATAMDLPVFMLGRTDMLQNRATAETAMQPTLRTWNSYQLLWRDVFSDLFGMVLDAKERYARGIRATFPERSVTVELSNPLEVDYETIAASINDYWDRGVIQPITLTRLALAQPELNLSPDSQEEIVNAMYPEAAREVDKRKAIDAMSQALREGKTWGPEDVGRLLEDGHVH